MKIFLIFYALVLLQALPAAAQDFSPYASPVCDCSEYPFKPRNCYDICAVKLASGSAAEIDQVRDIDAGVSLSLHVLNQNRNAWSMSDLSGVVDKKSLQQRALHLLRQADAFDEKPAPPDYQGNERLPKSPI